MFFCIPVWPYPRVCLGTSRVAKWPNRGVATAGRQETCAAHTCLQVQTTGFRASLDLTLRINFPESGTGLEEDAREDGGMTGCGSGKRFLQTTF